jgi:hypothetical protein
MCMEVSNKEVQRLDQSEKCRKKSVQAALRSVEIARLMRQSARGLGYGPRCRRWQYDATTPRWAIIYDISIRRLPPHRPIRSHRGRRASLLAITPRSSAPLLYLHYYPVPAF